MIGSMPISMAGRAVLIGHLCTISLFLRGQISREKRLVIRVGRDEGGDRDEGSNRDPKKNYLRQLHEKINLGFTTKKAIVQP
jgi:hypothetical protein